MPRNGTDGRFAAAGLAFLLTLSGCGTAPPPEPEPVARTTAPAITVTPLSPSLEPATPEPPAREAPAEKQQAYAPQPTEPVDDNPDRLLKLTGMKVAALLGPANFVRRDGPAEVWQYRADNCVLDVFLYRQGSGLSVAHVDLRQRSGTSVPARQCFGELLASRH
jgi:hypothetical protein